ncbi:hypothetical protein HDU99_005187 [Rhizoclosmatium hyalinum]|nr:hypothetical protein HDU99_005187 [Rhizoclosmatium hyalinum]
MDAYTNVFASTSRRNYPKTNGGGKFLVYGPNSPKVVDESGFDAVWQAPTNLVWLLSRTEVRFGVNFGFRAGIAATGIAGNLKEDAVYYSGRLDSNGNVLKGTLSYVIDFPVDIPADAFWSITAYYGANGTLIQNAAGIYAVGSHSLSLVQHSAGFYRIQLQSSKPTQNNVNWLPTPSSAEFYLIVRFYQPHAEVLSNIWPVPWIVPVVEYGAISGSGDSPVVPVGTWLYSAGGVVKVSLSLIAALFTFII